MTVEAAVALSALTLVLVVCLAGIAAMVAQIRVTDAAAEAARLMARGDRPAAEAAVRRLAPEGTSMTISGGQLVTVQVHAPPLGGLLPGVTLSARVVVAAEPDVVAEAGGSEDRAAAGP